MLTRVFFVWAILERKKEAGFLLLEAYSIKELLLKLCKMIPCNRQMWLFYKQIIALKRITKLS